MTAIILAVAMIGAAFLYLAPPQLGGTTSIVTVDGTSMLPHIHSSDMIALRPSDTYHIGDVVGYHSQLLHRVVLHRIVAIDAGHYTFKGDNNSFLDPEHPTKARLVGKLWLQIPAAGRFLPLAHIPWLFAALAAVLVAMIGYGGRREPGTDEPSRIRT